MTPQNLAERLSSDTDVVQLARDLIGCSLLTETDGLRTAGIITETEAYRAPDDRASHAYGNRRTKRTEIMFAEGGHAYIYLCYGIHHLFNVVTGPRDVAHAVLVRALLPVEGTAVMLERRKMHRAEARLTSGPGTLSQALGLTTALNGQYLFAPDSPVRLQPRITDIPSEWIASSPRIGVDYAGSCAAWPWRFFIHPAFLECLSRQVAASQTVF